MIQNSSTNQNLSSIIEALLFVAGEPIAIGKLAELSGSSVRKVEEAIKEWERVAAQRGGVRILQKDGLVAFVTAPHTAPYIEKFIKEEVLGDLSKAALEALTIVAYRHPITRPEIDFIRGVNSAFTLRNLTARGLIERVSLFAGREYQYRPTLEFMKFLGLSSFQELPEFENVQSELTKGIENIPDESA